MSTSTDGQICYGIVFPEGYQFPWDDETFCGDLSEWWLFESGWNFSGPCPWDESGDYAPGFSREDPRINVWYESRRLWLAGHPCPVIAINYQSAECPAWILAIPSTLTIAHRGYPKRIESQTITINSDHHRLFFDFIEKYNLQGEESPDWYLSSYWG